MSHEDPIHQLATFVSELRAEALEDRVRDKVAILILDTIASALAGRDQDGCTAVEAMASALGGQRTSSTIGGTANSLMGAVIINGYRIAASSVCDFHRGSLSHLTPSVIPPALALAEQRELPGSDFLAAVASGLETSARLGKAIGATALRAGGWYPSGVIGSLGGAAAVASLMGLDREGTVNALSLASTQSSGTLAHRGTPTLTFQQSRGGFSALLASMLAERNFRASSDPLTAERGGMFNIFSDSASPEELTADLLGIWELEQISLRRWSVPNPLQPLVDALFQLTEEEEIAPADVAEVEVGVSTTSFRAFGQTAWEDGISARSSIPYVIAVGLQDGDCGPHQFREQRIHDPALKRFIEEAVHVEARDTIWDERVMITLRTLDNRRLSRDAQVAHGDPRDPLTWEEVVAKFQKAADGVIPAIDADRAIDMASDLASVDSVSELCAVLSTTNVPPAPERLT